MKNSNFSECVQCLTYFSIVIFFLWMKGNGLGIGLGIFHAPLFLQEPSPAHRAPPLQLTSMNCSRSGVFQVVWLRSSWEGEDKQTPKSGTPRQGNWETANPWCFHGLREFNFGGMDMSNICTSKQILNKSEQVSHTYPSIIRAPSSPSAESWVHFSVRANMKLVKKSPSLVSSTLTNFISF